MVQKLIYLDTNLWNRLLDQNVDPMELLTGLKRRNATLVLSGQTVYELTRTFRTSTARGKELFRYVKIYIESGIIWLWHSKVAHFGSLFWPTLG